MPNKITKSNKQKIIKIMENQEVSGRKHFCYRWVIYIPILIVAGIFLFSLAVMLLWNAIIPAVFSLAKITFWQALGILVLSKILFGGFHHGFKGRHHAHPGAWKHKWMHMTEEERVHAREEWVKRCRHQPEA